MSHQSRQLAGILLIVLPTVAFGGVSLLRMLINDPAYMENPLRQDLWRAGHAHAGVLLLLSLIALRYVDEANLSSAGRRSSETQFPSRRSCCHWRSFSRYSRRMPKSQTQ